MKPETIRKKIKHWEDRKWEAHLRLQHFQEKLALAETGYKDGDEFEYMGAWYKIIDIKDGHITKQQYDFEKKEWITPYWWRPQKAKFLIEYLREESGSPFSQKPVCDHNYPKGVDPTQLPTEYYCKNCLKTLGKIKVG